MNLTSKVIYDTFIFEFLRIRTTLVPSRIEKKVTNVKWSNSYKNFRNLSDVDPLEKELAFKVIQDLVPVPGRLHQKVDKRCLRKMKNNVVCTSIADKEHYFHYCDSIKEASLMFKSIAHKILQKNNIQVKDLLYFSFRGRGKNREKMFSWVLIKCYKRIFYDKITDGKKIIREILLDMDFAEKSQLSISKIKEFLMIKEVMLNLVK